jgi:two-component sensor histidine kinase/PAS domain-containing protein
MPADPAGGRWRLRLIIGAVGRMLYGDERGASIRNGTREREAPAEIAAIYEAAPVGLAFLDRALRYVRVNARLAALHDVPIDRHLGRTVREVLGDGRADLVEPLYRQVIETQRPVINREARGRNPLPPHDVRVWLSNYYPMVVDGAAVGVNVVVQDVTDLKRGEDRLLSFEALLANMTEGFALCDAIWDDAGKLIDYTIIEMNAALQQMLHVGPDAIGTKLSDSQGERSGWLRLCEQVLKTGEPASFEIHTEGADTWHEIRITRVTPARMAQLFFDITERKRAEAHQAHLFDELNHRINNNLMLVSGILRMKARETDIDGVRDQLVAADNRVQSIAQVHKALYRGARRDIVDFDAYLAELCVGVQQALVHDGRIEVVVEAEPLALPVDTAISLGMVVNELVTNAVKYAYPAPQPGRIEVRLTRTAEGMCLRVSDTGRGLPAVLKLPPGRGLGMKLVRSLVAQVSGDLVVSGPPGAAFEVRAPLP